jgi:hypothetical protein
VLEPVLIRERHPDRRREVQDVEHRRMISRLPVCEGGEEASGRCTGPVAEEVLYIQDVTACGASHEQDYFSRPGSDPVKVEELREDGDSPTEPQPPLIYPTVKTLPGRLPAV